MELTTRELFSLGVAYGSFTVSEIDQGIHMILPMTDYKTCEKINWVFKDLFDDYIEPIAHDSDGTPYLQAIIAWAKVHDIDLGVYDQ